VKSYDLLVIGGGMAGVSLGYEMAADRSVGLLEMESTLAFHTTGRSAATFLESYGGPYIRGLTVASREFFENPPDTFESAPLSPLPLLWLAPEGRGLGGRRRGPGGSPPGGAHAGGPQQQA
jgi:D-arginine dehydrogenase